MKTLYEYLTAKGLHAGSLPLDLANSIPYDALIDKILGTEIITYQTIVQVNN